MTHRRAVASAVFGCDGACSCLPRISVSGRILRRLKVSSNLTAEFRISPGWAASFSANRINFCSVSVNTRPPLLANKVFLERTLVLALKCLLARWHNLFRASRVSQARARLVFPAALASPRPPEHLLVEARSFSFGPDQILRKKFID